MRNKHEPHGAEGRKMDFDRGFIELKDLYHMKSILERIWGKKAYKDLKNNANLGDWKKYAVKTLNASRCALEVTIEVYDGGWKEVAESILDRAILDVKECRDIENLLSVIASAYIEFSFHQLGLCPDRFACTDKVDLRKSNWQLNKFRDVQYVQTRQQGEDLESYNETRRKCSEDSK